MKNIFPPYLPSSVSSPRAVYSHSLPLLYVRFLPQDAVLPELVLHGLPTGCSFAGTALMWIPTMGPILLASSAPASGLTGSSVEEENLQDV